MQMDNIQNIIIYSMNNMQNKNKVTCNSRSYNKMRGIIILPLIKKSFVGHLNKSFILYLHFYSICCGIIKFLRIMDISLSSFYIWPTILLKKLFYICSTNYGQRCGGMPQPVTRYIFFDTGPFSCSLQHFPAISVR